MNEEYVIPGFLENKLHTTFLDFEIYRVKSGLVYLYVGEIKIKDAIAVKELWNECPLSGYKSTTAQFPEKMPWSGLSGYFIWLKNKY